MVMMKWDEWRVPVIVGAGAGFLTGSESLFGSPHWVSNSLELLALIVAGAILASHQLFAYRDSFRCGFAKAFVYYFLGTIFKALRLSNNPHIAELDRLSEPFRSHNSVIEAISLVTASAVVGAFFGLCIWTF